MSQLDGLMSNSKPAGTVQIGCQPRNMAFDQAIIVNDIVDTVA